MKQTIKIQKVFIAILLILNLIICVLSYKLQIDHIAIIKENQELRKIIEIREEK